MQKLMCRLLLPHYQHIRDMEVWPRIGFVNSGDTGIGFDYQSENSQARENGQCMIAQARV